MGKRLLWILAGAILFSSSSCKQKKSGFFQVTGTFKNANGLDPGPARGLTNPGSGIKLVLAELSFGRDQTPVVLDSTRLLGNNGTFSVKANGRPQGIYELIFADNVISIPLINDAENIRVDIDLAKRDNFYTVGGSAASRQLQDLIDGFGKKNFQVEKCFSDLDSLHHRQAPDSLLIAATQTKNMAIKELNNFLLDFMHATSNSTLAVLALSWSARSFSKSDFETALNEQQAKYPDNGLIKTMKTSYDQQEAAVNQQGNSWVGKQVPDLSLPDPNGKPVPISSFKGHFLLIDFWASWCGPCRQENPNVVKVYHEFRNKNFTILGVSLDKEKEPWKQAILQDKLTWTHVSDLKFWDSKAVALFKFEGIPFNILVDPEGKVIAQELRGQDLETKLSEVLK